MVPPAAPHCRELAGAVKQGRRPGGGPRRLAAPARPPTPIRRMAYVVGRRPPSATRSSGRGGPARARGAARREGTRPRSAVAVDTATTWGQDAPHERPKSSRGGGIPPHTAPSPFGLWL